MCYPSLTAHRRGCVRLPAHTPWTRTPTTADRNESVGMKILDIPQSGKEGLHVSMPGRYGQSRRTLVIPTNPNTDSQKAQREIFAKVNKAWRALTEAQRLAWHAAAASIKSKPRLGQSGPLTGSQHHAAVNAVLATLGQDPITDPPAPAVFDDLAVDGLAIANNAGAITIKLNCPGDPGANTIVRASEPLSQGRKKTNDFRMIGMCPAPAQGVADITALYAAKFGAPIPGTKVFVRVNVASNGQESQSRDFWAIVPAAA